MPRRVDHRFSHTSKIEAMHRRRHGTVGWGGTCSIV
jgi:hypothetical protein